MKNIHPCGLVSSVSEPRVADVTSSEEVLVGKELSLKNRKRNLGGKENVSQDVSIAVVSILTSDENQFELVLIYISVRMFPMEVVVVYQKEVVSIPLALRWAKVKKKIPSLIRHLRDRCS